VQLDKALKEMDNFEMGNPGRLWLILCLINQRIVLLKWEIQANFG